VSFEIKCDLLFSLEPPSCYPTVEPTRKETGYRRGPSRASTDSGYIAMAPWEKRSTVVATAASTTTSATTFECTLWPSRRVDTACIYGAPAEPLPGGRAVFACYGATRVPVNTYSPSLRLATRASQRAALVGLEYATATTELLRCKSVR